MVPGSRPDSIIGVDKSRKTIMTNKQIFPWLIFAVLVVMMALKLLADFQPLPGIGGRTSRRWILAGLLLLPW